MGSFTKRRKCAELVPVATHGAKFQENKVTMSQPKRRENNYLRTYES